MERQDDLPIYPIRIVAAISGVDARRLRSWEAVYQLLRPARTKGGRRLYSTRDLRLVQRIRRLVEDECMSLQGVKAWLAAQPDVDESNASVAALSRIPEPFNATIIPRISRAEANTLTKAEAIEALRQQIRSYGRFRAGTNLTGDGTARDGCQFYYLRRNANAGQAERVVARWCDLLKTAGHPGAIDTYISPPKPHRRYRRACKGRTAGWTIEQRCMVGIRLYDVGWVAREIGACGHVKKDSQMEALRARVGATGQA